MLIITAFRLGRNYKVGPPSKNQHGYKFIAIQVLYFVHCPVSKDTKLVPIIFILLFLVYKNNSNNFFKNAYLRNTQHPVLSELKQVAQRLIASLSIWLT